MFFTGYMLPSFFCINPSPLMPQRFLECFLLSVLYFKTLVLIAETLSPLYSGWGRLFFHQQCIWKIDVIFKENQKLWPRNCLLAVYYEKVGMDQRKIPFSTDTKYVFLENSVCLPLVIRVVRRLSLPYTCTLLYMKM